MGCPVTGKKDGAGFPGSSRGHRRAQAADGGLRLCGPGQWLPVAVTGTPTHPRGLRDIVGWLGGRKGGGDGSAYCLGGEGPRSPLPEARQHLATGGRSRLRSQQPSRVGDKAVPRRIGEPAGQRWLDRPGPSLRHGLAVTVAHHPQRLLQQRRRAAPAQRNRRGARTGQAAPPGKCCDDREPHPDRNRTDWPDGAGRVPSRRVRNRHPDRRRHAGRTVRDPPRALTGTRCTISPNAPKNESSHAWAFPNPPSAPPLRVTCTEQHVARSVLRTSSEGSPEDPCVRQQLCCRTVCAMVPGHIWRKHASPVSFGTCGEKREEMMLTPLLRLVA